MSRFPTTQWSLVDLASCESATGSREEMGRLLDTYRQPMYIHLRARGVKHEQAEDLIQEFQIEILNQKLLTIADPKKGKFRTLLLTALDRFMVGKHRYETASKRSPGKLASLDASEALEATTTEAQPSLVFERAWALDVLAQALEAMHEECISEDHEARWSVFNRRVVAPLLDDAAKPEYEELATAYGLKDEKAAMNLLVTAKRQFARILRDQVRDYVTRANDPDQMREQVASQLATRETDPETAMRVAQHVVEQNIRHAVQEELDQLEDILSHSQSVADLAQLPEHLVAGSSPIKSKFWRRLAAVQTIATVNELYAGDANVDSSSSEETPLDSYLLAIINSDVSEFSGLRVDAQGTLRTLMMCDEPDVETLRGIKDWSNLLRASRDKSLPADLASGLYYFVNAIGLVRCNTRISGLGTEALRSGFVWLNEQDWLLDDMRPLVDEALAKI